MSARKMPEIHTPLPSDVAARLTKGGGKCPQVLLGPVVQSPAGFQSPYWFVTVSEKRKQPQIEIVACDSREQGEVFRTGVMLALTAKPPALVMDFGSELEMAKYGLALWPGKLMEGIVARIEGEAAMSA